MLQPEKIEGSIYSAVTDNALGLDPEVGAVAVGFDREFNYDKILRATSYLNNPDCLFLGTNTDEKYKVIGTNFHLPGKNINYFVFFFYTSWCLVIYLCIIKCFLMHYIEITKLQKN